ncbi:protein RRP6-like 3 isoform X2 [Cornus florida]|uniref:protein RRP6-like 3 isoform X2 n=1 Tax=Cornus florida TaxID=4283 RepID=UPI00289A5667|nr:protein RRP6-like 3 isoform X2 [Cornus florida]
MESRDKIKIAFTIACFAAISVFFTTQYRKHRKQKQSPNSCYLKTESKSQNTFKRVLADNSYSPFKHLKHNHSNSEVSSKSHPFETEITTLLKNPELEFSFIDENMDLKMGDSYVWVETESQLRELVDVLSGERVFGVDTEQHSLRSFLGFTALIQISTQREDYLVDTIALHDVMSILRPVFSNPDICKVFHGADNDVLWLQRDFHIYIVNLFDTAKACEVLSKPQKSLAYLLETYCGVATNKLFQREDWRQRPLTIEMVQYARTDAHYLLYIARCLVSELKRQDNENSACCDDEFHFVLEASRRSNAICLQLFSKEIEACPGEYAASSIISRCSNDQGLICDTKFQDLVRRLCTWRDLMARVHDESLRYVLSDYAVIALADRVPTTEAEIYDTISQADPNFEYLNLSSLQFPSPIVCSHVEDFDYLLQDRIGKPDDIFQPILQMHLGPNGSCPLSIFNYALLSKTNMELTNRLVSKQNRFKNSRQIAKKASRELFVQKFSCKSPVYHNCRIYANDGRLLCYCDRRKLEWYLRRDLAKLVEDDPPGIMLLFEPKGRPEDEGNEFYIHSKKNICVGCGEGNHYLRYRIIPSCYRVHFPEHLKSHRSHDIVLLCVDCHEIAHTAAEKYKRQVAAEFGIPLFVRKVVDSTQPQDESSSSIMDQEEVGVSPLQLRTAAMALLRHGPTMPSKRREELKQIVVKYFGGREISEEDLERALLVGMGPQERRRLEKKKGISFKHSTGIINPVKKLENNSCSEVTSASLSTQNVNKVTSASLSTQNVNNIDNSHAMKGEMCSKEDDDLSMAKDMNVSRSFLGADLEVNGEVSAADSKNTNLDRIGDSEAICISVLDTDDNFERRIPSNGTDNSFPPSSEENGSSKHNSKLSLLGHGPHGKQVVDHLLNEYGEDGILQFCQRWRHVFVEAVHPRFLPAGWDITHSGRRDFGDFSVYNPVKKVSVAANV